MNPQNTSLLNTLNLPSELKKLSHGELEELAKEIRSTLIEIGNICGGHLASNLGVVELTLCLHAVLTSPIDKIIFDTSHQCYVHKMLTGRRDQMFTIRQENGLSGFAKIDESEHDIFGAGHASTSLSAALGIAHARNLRNENYAVFAILGDASLSGGMAYEALNNIGKLKGNFVCILNDNNMSISKPVGNMSTYITQLRTSQGYNSAKDKLERIFHKIPNIGVPLYKKIEKTIYRMRNIVLDFKVDVIFEEFGFRYLGPIDGHNIPLLMAAIKYAKNYDGPIMIHIITTKGKGYNAAEADPIKYHGVSPQKNTNPESKKLEVSSPASPQETFTEVFGRTTIELAKKHPDLVVITPAMTGGSGLTKYAEQFPDRFFDVGIAEEHAVTFCAGLIRAGIKPILAIYSTFLQRGYDQVIHDVCIQKLPVVFALDRAGITGEDGPTHHGMFDMAFLLSIPNIIILAPKDGDELHAMLTWSVTQELPVSIRYPKGAVPKQNGLITTPLETPTEVLTSWTETSLPKILIIGVGSMSWLAYEAAKEHPNCTVINCRFIKPLDISGLLPHIQKADHILVIEEGCRIGGVFSHLLTEMPVEKNRSQWHSIAIPDHFIEHGKIDSLRHQCGLSQKSITEKINTLSTCH
jgi:1-deoxy-D-xylulose-5-phosphate synthase